LDTKLCKCDASHICVESAELVAWLTEWQWDSHLVGHKVSASPCLTLFDDLSSYWMFLVRSHKLSCSPL